MKIHSNPLVLYYGFKQQKKAQKKTLKLMMTSQGGNIPILTQNGMMLDSTPQRGTTRLPFIYQSEVQPDTACYKVQQGKS